MIVTSKYSDHKRCCYKQKRRVISVRACMDQVGGRKESLYLRSSVILLKEQLCYASTTLEPKHIIKPNRKTWFFQFLYSVLLPICFTKRFV